MTTYKAGDIVLVFFPFTSGARGKKRAALVLLDTGDDDVLVARITSRQRSPTVEIAISDWQNAGLLGPSFVRLHKLATLQKTAIIRQIGTLQPVDRPQVSAVLHQLFGNW